ncbi:hypothetical protein NGG16_02500 [Enterococcus casseliflavus]|uniref:hypothetical protein n=1 Tax=Enterococcus casseliflavus TaxID=37734 RepID=UPI002DBCDF76|nr:hypothetical protein [Enterococcus casseliflavus]MEB8416304.1 hypothetical protein [Enterococcus casseliflavus]
MKIKVTELNYRFDEEGHTSAVEVQYQSYNNGNNFSARVVLENMNFDEMTRADFENEARKTINEWLNESE